MAAKVALWASISPRGKAQDRIGSERYRPVQTLSWKALSSATGARRRRLGATTPPCCPAKTSNAIRWSVGQPFAIFRQILPSNGSLRLM